MVYVSSGCTYSDGYVWTAYPYSSFPSGGIFRKLPDFYQDYEREKKKYKERFEKEQEKSYHRFPFEGFFGFDEDVPLREDNYPYSVFGLKKSSSDEDMKRAYRKSILKTHPDKPGGNAELFRKIQEAWDYFKDYLRATSTS